MFYSIYSTTSTIQNVYVSSSKVKKYNSGTNRSEYNNGMDKYYLKSYEIDNFRNVCFNVWYNKLLPFLLRLFSGKPCH